MGGETARPDGAVVGEGVELGDGDGTTVGAGEWTA